MRKVAREAVIFALLGAVFASIWFLVEESRSRQRREVERELADARAAAASDDPAYRILFIAQDVDNDTRTEAYGIFYQKGDLDEFTRRLRPLNLPQSTKSDLWEAKAPCVQEQGQGPWEKYRVRPVYCGNMTPPPPPGFRLDLPDSVRWPQTRATWFKIATDSLSPALFLGFILGFPAGFGTWVFYRLVRFAIRG